MIHGTSCSIINSFVGVFIRVIIVSRHHLERPCIVDSEEAVKEADVIGVIHDAANEYTRMKLDEKVLRILLTYPRKRTFLVLNKVSPQLTQQYVGLLT